MNTLHKHIAAYPLEATQREWAEFLGISQPYLSQLLSGKRRPHPKIMQQIEARTHGAVPAASWLDAPDRIEAPEVAAE